ncbi:MAG: site-specific DNA-methyltransferase [Pirellulales bacterium]|nr:site-specific DNA-methyltransferase [Pirellulales bacterium]
MKDLFPEAFVEGQIDFDRLRNALGDFVGEGRERYGLSWAGKADAIRAIQAPSIGTLVPCPEESVNFDTTENLFIEGDNLEVLKLLQKSYYGKVKMIYIDPPYNTGGEFIYPDNFQEGLADYLRYSGQVGEGGVRLSTNPETSGRYHSKWLDMMYPRLFLARNLLRQDGVIFVSIDDHEIQNLRLLMDEVFGGENFVATLIWQKVYSPKNTAKHFSEDHDYVLVFARDADHWRPVLLPRSEEANARYSNPDNDERGDWKPGDMTARNYYSEGQYEVTSPGGKNFNPPRGRYWVVNQERFEELNADRRIWWGEDGLNMPALKRFLTEVKQGMVPQTLWLYADVGHTQEAKKELVKYAQFTETENVLNSVKPTRLIQRMLQIATQPKESDIVLDFFAGSAATGHAVLNQNVADEGNRRFILVQLPEPLPKPEPGLKTIFDLGAVRLRNATKEITSDANGKLDGLNSADVLPLLGFRKLKLTSSNFKIWDGTGEATAAELEKQLGLFADHVLPDRTEQDVLYELMLKAGLPLTAAIEQKAVAGQKVYAIADGLLAICLANPISQECLRGIMELAPQRVICLDAAFGGNDQLKTNTVLEMKSHGIEFRTV